MTRRLLTVSLLFAAAIAAPLAQAQAREEARVLVATQVLEESRGQRDQFIPDRLLERAYGIAVIPEVKKVAFGVGGRFGRGVLVVRDKQGRFGNPVFISLTGGSFGWQIGAQEADIILVFTTRRGVEGIADGKLTLGADASVAAGPVGRAASAGTDANFSAEVYSYSRARGLFAGVALDGTAMTIDNRANRNFYGNRSVNSSDIISGSVTKDSETVRRLMKAVSTSTRTPDANAPAPAAPAGTPAPTAPATAPAAGEAARSYPMEDAKPGTEPPHN